MPIRLTLKYLVLLTLLTSGCRIAPKFQGSYNLYDGFVYGNLKLNQDSTFNYYLSTCLYQEKASGKWKIEGNYLVLNTFDQRETDEFKYVKRSNDITQKFISVLVKDTDGNEIIGGIVTFVFDDGTKIFKISDTTGIAICKECIFDIKSITVIYIGYNTFHISLKKEDTFDNKFEVILRSIFPYKYITNEKWRMRRNKLIDPQSKQSWKYYLSAKK